MEMVSKMPEENIIKIDDLTLYFPFKPYECQETYMRAVIKALQTRNNAALESPTGTGKTLCLLTAVLGYI